MKRTQHKRLIATQLPTTTHSQKEGHMRIKRQNQKGFSLVELMIVLVIIGILAAVGVPIYSANVTKAKMSEADATLGTIRTSLRVYYAENGVYPTVAADTEVGSAGIGIKATELDGKYFSASSFILVSTDSTYTITCSAGSILDSDRNLDQAGTFTGGVD
ncbi:MAG: hypothetical protein COY19_11250 [Candidatus Marinimicrobia bacterium CG_4_10_14_0_2_um_filter_48_9]|nr:MAG: hypothetical protein COY19_11250 [Candidatus Marinimicrobia bacterium CG_4_10_14_0_2_um_filter_48_9]